MHHAWPRKTCTDEAEFTQFCRSPKNSPRDLARMCDAMANIPEARGPLLPALLSLRSHLSAKLADPLPDLLRLNDNDQHAQQSGMQVAGLGKELLAP